MKNWKNKERFEVAFYSVVLLLLCKAIREVFIQLPQSFSNSVGTRKELIMQNTAILLGSTVVKNCAALLFLFVRCCLKYVFAYKAQEMFMSL